MPKSTLHPQKRAQQRESARPKKSVQTKKLKQAGPVDSRAKRQAKAAVKKINSALKHSSDRKVMPHTANKAQKINRLQEAMVRRGSKMAVGRSARVNAVRIASLKPYEAAVKLMYAQEFEKAKKLFEKVIESYAEDKELVERARIHLRLCEQKISRKAPTPRSVDEHYNLAIAFYNQNQYKETFEHLRKALKYDPSCDYVFYALAATSCKTGDLETALHDLQEAINLKPENRFLAQRDEDFSPLKEDARFISIVFPDRPS